MSPPNSFSPRKRASICAMVERRYSAAPERCAAAPQAHRCARRLPGDLRLAVAGVDGDRDGRKPVGGFTPRPLKPINLDAFHGQPPPVLAVHRNANAAQLPVVLVANALKRVTNDLDAVVEVEGMTCWRGPLPSNAGEVARTERPAPTGTQTNLRCRKQSSEQHPDTYPPRPSDTCRARVAQIPIRRWRIGEVQDHQPSTHRFGKTRAACAPRRARRGRCAETLERSNAGPCPIAPESCAASDIIFSRACTISGNGAAAPGTT